MTQEDLIAQALVRSASARSRLVAAIDTKDSDRFSQLEMAMRELALTIGRVAEALEMT